MLLLSLALFLATAYTYYEQQVYAELSVGADCVAQGVERWGAAYFEEFRLRDRVTWVAADGTVLYDSQADAASMENHLDREEIQQALATGEAKSSHESRTLAATTHYYARRLADGTVLRLSCQRSTIPQIFRQSLQPFGWALVLLVLISALLASRMARSIVRPINSISLDHPEQQNVYKELAPLVDRLREQNLTIRRQMDELGTRQREFSVITDNMSEGFLLIDNRGVILTRNASAARYLKAGGCESLRTIGQVDCPRVLRACVEAAIAGQRSEHTVPLEDRSVCIIASPVVASGQVTGAMVMAMDVTEREQRETLRREFSANVSHELKTPLTSISGFAELMKEGLVPSEKMREFAGDIYAESRRLIALVDDIIKLSGLDENAPAFEPEPVELLQLCREIAAQLEPVAAKRQVTLSVSGKTAPYQGVRHILSEMIYNLCDNAIKYNKDGGRVELRVETRGTRAAVVVADTGIGIPYAHQDRVFERFYRVDKSHSKEIGGTGLGLSIVKHGAQYHNAQVQLESEPGAGTTVTVLF